MFGQDGTTRVRNDDTASTRTVKRVGSAFKVAVSVTMIGVGYAVGRKLVGDAVDEIIQDATDRM